jgi:AcrR family transcriptional regulator
VRRTLDTPGGSSARFAGGGGSNRDPRAHRAILDATADLLEEVGYERMSMDAIAKRADVGKPTLYRWWKNKAALAHEVMLERAGTFSYVDTGDLDLDLHAFVEQTVRFFSTPLVQAAWPGAVADLRADPDAWREAYDTMTRPAADHLRTILRQAAERGEARADADHRTAFDAIVGTCMNQLNTPGRPRSRKARIDGLVALLLHGLRA